MNPRKRARGGSFRRMQHRTAPNRRFGGRGFRLSEPLAARYVTLAPALCKVGLRSSPVPVWAGWGLLPRRFPECWFASPFCCFCTGGLFFFFPHTTVLTLESLGDWGRGMSKFCHGCGTTALGWMNMRTLLGKCSYFAQPQLCTLIPTLCGNGDAPWTDL